MYGNSNGIKIAIVIINNLLRKLIKHHGACMYFLFYFLQLFFKNIFCHLSDILFHKKPFVSLKYSFYLTPVKTKSEYKNTFILYYCYYYF